MIRAALVNAKASRDTCKASRRKAILAALFTAVGAVGPLGSGLAMVPRTSSPRPHLDVRLFARVPSPGFPANAAVGPDGRVYVGSYSSRPGDMTPSRIFVFDPDGTAVRSFAIQGQLLSQTHGVTAAAFDADGILYVLDQAPARVIALDPRTGVQRDYARLQDVPPCSASSNQADCSATTTDNAASPDFAAFAPDGDLYITDFQQGLIWKVDRGGGDGHVWYTNPLLDGGLFGPAGIQFRADGRRLVFSVFTNLGSAQTVNPSTGKLYELSIGEDGRAQKLTKLWESQPDDAPDGFAVSISGHVYVALGGVGTNQLVELGSDGVEIARIPKTPAENALMPVPFDEPSGVTFDGNRLLVTNLSFVTENAHSWAIFDVYAGEPGLPLFRPTVQGQMVPPKTNPPGPVAPQAAQLPNTGTR